MSIRRLGIMLVGMLLLQVVGGGMAFAMGMKLGNYDINLEELQAGVFQDFKSGESLSGFSLPVLERVVQEVPLTLSVAGIQANADAKITNLKLGGIVSADGRSLAEKMGFEYRLPENIDLGLFFSYANQVERFGLYVSLKL